jgi:DNA-binding NtrC family response regulator
MNNPLCVFDGFTVVFVEDDQAVRSSLAQSLELAGLHVLALGSAEQACQHVSAGLRGIVVSDIRLPGMDGMALMQHVHSLDATIPCVLVTAHGDVALAVQAMQQGAYDFIEKPFSPERLVSVALRAMERRALQLEVLALRQQLNQPTALDTQLLGQSVVMQNLRQKVRSLASTSADVLIMGETGTGKERVARCLHDDSPRAGKNFVAINCAGLPESLLESELFGHEAGAFTSASKRRIGKLEHAQGGTLLLDEIESMPMGFQAKLLRVLQERKIERLGSNEEIAINIRVVAASKVDLLELCKQQKFRTDLYYRLNVAVLHLPPLRDRREDIGLLFEHFTALASKRHELPLPDMQGQLRHTLMAHDWPGNVRELANVAERFVLGLLGDLLLQTGTGPTIGLAQQMEHIEKMLIEHALRQHRGRASAAGQALGLPKKTMYDKIARHEIILESYRTPDQTDDEL